MNRGGFRTKISLDEALKRLLPLASGMNEERVGFVDAVSRLLSRDVVSGMDNPPFDRAMMDGYAVVAEDTFGASSTSPITLDITGSVETGDTPFLSINHGDAAKIMTGAHVPKGATAVLKVEYTRKGEGVVEVFESVPPGKNISKIGEDIKKGDLLLKKGRVINPYDVGVLAATSNLDVWVRKKPKVMIVSTGTELVKPGGKLTSGSIFDINAYTLSSLVKQRGGKPELYGIIQDSAEELKTVVTSSGWDVLIISGATSVGEKDFVPSVIESQGSIVFHGVNIRPGSPVGFGVVGRKPVFMLPGFPVASITAFELIVTPFLQTMLGDKTTHPHPVVEGVLEKAIPSQLGRVDFVRVCVEQKEDILKVLPISTKGAGLITTMSKAHGFVLVTGEHEGIEAGEKVMVYLF